MTAKHDAAVAESMVRAVLLVFMPFACGYFLSYLYRTVNAVIAPQLVQDLGLSASDLGLLTAAYFLAFAVFQLPLGLLLDRFGPRRVQACLLLSAALGALIFAWGTSREVLILGRALIGLGVAGGLMASFKAITLWFPQARWPLVNGCFVAVGGLGAMAATEPVEFLLGFTDWRGIFAGLSLATAAVSALIIAVVPERSGGAPRSDLRVLLAGLGEVYRDTRFWRFAPLSVLAAGSSMAIQSLWSGPWLKDVGGFDRPAVASGLLVIAAALTLGSLLTGLVADLLGRLGVATAKVMAVGLAVLLFADIVLALQLAPGSLWPWVLFALTSSCAMLSYPILSRHFPLELSGRVNTGINVMVFACAFTVQYAVGLIIDLWPSSPGGNYAPEGYRAAFGLVCGLIALAYIWFAAGWRRDWDPDAS